MGLTYIEGTATGVNGETRKIRFLVDSGATYTLLPNDVWTGLGLKSKRTVEVTLADGTRISRDVSECLLGIDGQEAHTPVILGEPGDEPLLGAVTLEIFGYVLDPFKRTLTPMRMMMA